LSDDIEFAPHLAAVAEPAADHTTFEERFANRRVDLFERYENGPPDIDYLPASDGMLIRGKRHLLPAPKKTGKSFSTLVHWVDMALAGARVTILDRENGADLYAGRLAAIVQSRGLNDEQRAQVRAGIVYYEFPKIRAYDRDNGDLVTELSDSDIVVFDSSRRFLTDLGLEENASDDYTKFMATAVDPLFEAGVATIILDNTGHQEVTRARGTTAKEDLNEIAFELETLEPYSQHRVGRIRLRLEAGKSRFGNEGTWDMTIGGGVYGSWEPVDLEAEQLESRDDAVEWIVQYVLEHPEGVTQTPTLKAYTDAHDGKGRNLAKRIYDRLLAGEHPKVSRGTGNTNGGHVLVPASQQTFPPPTTQTGDPGTPPQGRAAGTGFPASHSHVSGRREPQPAGDPERIPLELLDELYDPEAEAA
jgi:hypothetical protein